MRVTLIRLVTPEVLLSNAVSHECTLGEFLQDIHDETRRYARDNPNAKSVDVFWHLDEYCAKKYGDCHWQIVAIDSLL